MWTGIRFGGCARALAALTVAVAAGCVAVPPAMLISAGLSAAPSGVAAYQRGEMSVTLMIAQDRAYDAMIAAMEELDLTIGTTRFDERSAFLLARDDRGTEVKVRFHRHTDVVTAIRIRIGLMGNRTFSTLLLERMRQQAGLVQVVPEL